MTELPASFHEEIRRVDDAADGIDRNGLRRAIFAGEAEAAHRSWPAVRVVVAAVAAALLVAIPVGIAFQRGSNGSDGSDVSPTAATRNTLTASSSSTSTASTSTAVGVSALLEQVTDGTWMVTDELVAADGVALPVRSTFEVRADGRVVGHDGCNRFAFDLNGPTDKMLSTRPPDSVESTAVGCGDLGADSLLNFIPVGTTSVENGLLTIERPDGTVFEAVKLDSLVPLTSSEELVGVWAVASETEVEFTPDGTITTTCGVLGEWRFDASELAVVQAATFPAPECDDAERAAVALVSPWGSTNREFGVADVRRISDDAVVLRHQTEASEPAVVIRRSRN